MGGPRLLCPGQKPCRLRPRNRPSRKLSNDLRRASLIARARNLIACAREVARRGSFPKTSAELRLLPGLGGYTAAAIAAIAFGERVAAVDTNVVRVISRLHGLKDPGKAEIARLTFAMTPAIRPGDFAQALMDLGATICRPKSPLCAKCPLAQCCAAYASGNPELFPATKPKRIRPLRRGIVYWIERDSHVWLVRRPARGLLGGMAGLPGSEWSERMPATAQRPLGTVSHAFTHFRLELAVERRSEPIDEGWWHSIDRLADAGLPTLYRRAAEVALRSKEAVRPAA